MCTNEIQFEVCSTWPRSIVEIEELSHKLSSSQPLLLIHCLGANTQHEILEGLGARSKIFHYNFITVTFQDLSHLQSNLLNAVDKHQAGSEVKSDPCLKWFHSAEVHDVAPLGDPGSQDTSM